MSFKIFILSLVSLLLCSTLRAEQQHETDTLQISLLTCTPGKAPYEFYGHTALRVQNTKSGQDLVFNYGIFDFDTPNFAWRFMTGQTDYTIGVSHFNSFAHSYKRQERSVFEQVLNLTPAEEKRLYESLMADWMTTGWTYRYNIFYDNCTTRAMGKINKAIDGKLILPIVENNQRSFRDILHEFSEENSPWYCFGEDLILGSELDKPLEVWKQMFSPIYAGRFMAQAYIMENDGGRRPLVSKTELAVQSITSADEAFPVTPMWMTCLLLLLVVGISFREFSQKKHFCLFDDVLMAVQGLVGCLVAFLFFISEHPAVDSNWLIVLLNPLPLLYLPIKVWRDHRGLKDYYHPALALALGIFVVSALLGIQKYPVAFYPLALILLVRVIVAWYFEKRKRINTK